MAKKSKKSAKSKKAPLTPEQKEAKKLANDEKYSSPVDKYVTINATKGIGKEIIHTQAMHIRGMGCLVRTLSPMGVSEVFVPGMKIKTKKAWKTLVKDVPKKGKE